MNLQEMLSYTASEFLDDRTELIDGDDDSLWSDSFLCRQFNEAQRILTRRAWVIIETGVAPAGIVVMQTGKVLYSLHRSILRVFDATPSTQTLPLGRANDIELRNTNLISPYPPDDFGAFEIGEAASLAGNVTNTMGTTLAIATDAGSRTLRVFPPPSALQSGVIVALKIARMPINFLSLDDTEACPEVPEEFHIALCEFAAGKALTLPNIDGTQKADGRLLIAGFQQVVKEARQERIRAEMGSNRWNFASTTALIR